MVLRPQKLALLTNAVVGLIGLFLAFTGVSGFLVSRGLIDALIGAGGLYALWQVAQTPLGLRVADGRVSRRGLFPASLPLKELARLQVRQSRWRRAPVLDFVRGDGSVAFTVDATLWNRLQLEELLGRKVAR